MNEVLPEFSKMFLFMSGGYGELAVVPFLQGLEARTLLFWLCHCAARNHLQYGSCKSQNLEFG